MRCMRNAKGRVAGLGVEDGVSVFKGRPHGTSAHISLITKVVARNQWPRNSADKGWP